MTRGGEACHARDKYVRKAVGPEIVVVPDRCRPGPGSGPGRPHAGDGGDLRVRFGTARACFYQYDDEYDLVIEKKHIIRCTARY